MRKTDLTPTHPPRSLERVFLEDDRWFVRTREGLRGPFGSRRAAEAEAALFVETLQYLEQHRPALPPGGNQTDVTVVHMNRLPWC